MLSCRRHDENRFSSSLMESLISSSRSVRPASLIRRSMRALVKFKMSRDWLSDYRCGDKDVALMRYDPVKSRWVKSDDFEIHGSDGRVEWL